MAEVRVAGGTIRYTEAGPVDAPPIVFVHGALVDGRLWTATADDLARRGHRVIVPDWPLGSHRVAFDDTADLSPRGVARIILQFLAELHLDAVTLVANDSGGALTQLLLGIDDSRIARVVFTNCDTFERFPPPPFNWLFRLARRPSLQRAALLPARLTFLRQFSFGLLAKRLDPALTKAWLEPGLTDAGIRRNFAAFVRAIDPKELTAAAAELHRFDGPVLFAWAPEDRFFRIADGRRLAECFQAARVVEIPDSRTFVALDQPARLAEEVDAFIAESRPAQPDTAAPPTRR